MSFTGATPPNPPNYSKTQYANLFNLGADGRPVQTIPGVGVNPNPPPYFDDGAAGSLIIFAGNTSALAGGSAATAGGTEGTYPGVAAGAVPASTSVAHEGAGTETSSTWGVGWPTGTAANVYNPNGPLVVVGTGPSISSQAVRDAGPNATHASTLSPTTNPALVSISPTSTVSGTGTQVLTCTGTGFVPGCRIWVNGVEQSTTFTNGTTISATVNKKATAGTWPVQVKLGGLVMGVTATWTFT
jgi:hypothetical protein